MFSEFLIRKMILGFYRMDVNQDGYVDADDFRTIAERIAQMRGVSAGTAQHGSIINTLQDHFQMYFMHADRNGDGKIAIREFLQSTEGLVTVDGFVETGLQQNGRLFDTLDLDNDGKIEKDEYGFFLQAAGVRPDDATTAFNRIDLDNDGVISRDEFALAIHQYFTSENLDDPGNWFFGPF